MSYKDKVREYIIENFLFGDGEKLADDDASFLENGIVDSTGILEIITFIEESFGVKIEDEEMLPENLDTLNNLEAFLSTKKAA